MNVQVIYDQRDDIWHVDVFHDEEHYACITAPTLLEAHDQVGNSLQMIQEIGSEERETNP